MRTLYRLRQNLLGKRAKGKSWKKAAISCGVNTKEGKINPGLAWRIAHGYEPRTIELRKRLGLPGKCPSCHHRIKPVIPAWLDQAVENLIILLERKESKHDKA